MKKEVEYISRDWKDTDGLIDDFIAAMECYGLYVYMNPMTVGTDQYSFMIHDEPLSKAELLQIDGSYEDYYCELKGEAMEEFDYTEEDMEDGSCEDEVNRRADELFREQFGCEYTDVIDLED